MAPVAGCPPAVPKKNTLPSVRAKPATPHYLAFDLGASSCRAVLGRLEGQRMHMSEVHRFRTPMVEEGPRLYWDLEVIWKELWDTAQRVSAAHHLRSLSVDSWGVDYVPLDAAMRPVRRAHCYRDPRVAGMGEVISRRVSPEAAYAITGVQPQTINTLFQVVADQVLTPEDYARTATRLLIADYFNYRFSGQAVAEVSAASTTQVFAPDTMRWAESLIERLGLRPETWPTLVPSGTRLGTASAAGAAVEVIAGCSHDTACAVAAVPAEAGPGRWAFLSSGTWSILGMETEVPMRTAQAFALGYTHEVGFNNSIRLLKNLTGLWVLQECERTWREAGDTFDYDTLLNEARRAAPLHGVVDLSDPRFAARGDMPARVHAYCREKGIQAPKHRGSMVRLILESLAEAYRAALRQLETLTGGAVTVLHIVGGGARNAYLNQRTADQCGCRVVAGPAEATALGNLLVQAYAMGDLDSPAQVRAVAASSSKLQVYEPGGRA